MTNYAHRNTHKPPVFTFVGHRFDPRRGRATFYYRAASGRHFAEKVDFQMPETYRPSKTQQKLLNRTLDLALFILGTSYYKSQPTVQIKSKRPISPQLANLLNHVYQEGLSQFAYENNLERQNLAHFEPNDPQSYWHPIDYDGAGILSLQSGGKDSLLVAELLAEDKKPFRPVYITSQPSHPAVLDQLHKPLIVIRRHLDLKSLKHAKGLNGHVPVTYINYVLAFIQAILLGYHEVTAGIGDEGIEPHAKIGDLEIRHQWAKTKQAEDLLNNFIHSEISPTLKITSPLRGKRELDIAEQFAEKCWRKYGQSFSSCNVANYKQNHDNKHLKWCGHCPKCANSYLLFAPFIPAPELIATIGNGKDLFADSALTDTFKGLLGIDNHLKPFECVGEIAELREAYHRKQAGFANLPFAVPTPASANSSPATPKTTSISSAKPQQETA